MTLDAAIEVFVRAFSQGKSIAHPYRLERVDGLWIMRDTPGRAYMRKSEVVTSGFSPKETVRIVLNANIGWHFLCDVQGLDGEFGRVRGEYKALGYRAVSTEWMFVHDLASLPEYDSDPPVRLVESQQQLREVKQVAQQPRRLHAGTRLYGVWDDSRDYGWVESVPVENNAWVSGLHVHEDHRGRGFGRALMSRLLQDDKAAGLSASVLLASSDGARLYPHLGYEKIGVLQAFCPRKRG